MLAGWPPLSPVSPLPLPLESSWMTYGKTVLLVGVVCLMGKAVLVLARDLRIPFRNPPTPPPSPTPPTTPPSVPQSEAKEDKWEEKLAPSGQLLTGEMEPSEIGNDVSDSEDAAESESTGEEASKKMVQGEVAVLDFSNRGWTFIDGKSPAEFWNSFARSDDVVSGLPWGVEPRVQNRHAHASVCLNDNALEQFHASAFPRLVSIHALDLSRNALEQLPADLGLLTCLCRLELCANRLHSLPDVFESLRSLEYLDLGRNAIVQLPASLGKCHRLRYLDISENKLSTLPTSMGYLLPVMETFWTQSNPWETPFKDLLPLAYLNPLKKRISRAELPSKLVKKNRRISADSMNVTSSSATLHVPLVRTFSRSPSRSSRAVSPSKLAATDDSCSETISFLTAVDSDVESAPSLRPNSNASEMDVLEVTKRDSSILFEENGLQATNLPKSMLALQRTCSARTGARSASAPTLIALPTHRESAPLDNPVMNRCGLKYVLCYLRDLHDLDPMNHRSSNILPRTVSELQAPSHSMDSLDRSEPSISPSQTPSSQQISPIGCSIISATGSAVDVIKRQCRREKIIKEILATESSYVGYLQVVRNLYIQPLESEQLLQRDELRILFSNLSTIHLMHETLLQDLQTDNVSVGNVFLKHAAYLRMYSVYINNFDTAMVELERLLTKKKFKAFCQAAQSHPTHTQTNLQFYLIMPVQRIPRYVLLLEELFKCTDLEDPDYPNLESALKEIRKRATEINERKREREVNDKIIAIQNRIKGMFKTALVQPHRRLLREAVLTVDRTVKRAVKNKIPYLKEQVQDREFLFFLFNDMLIQCKLISNSLSLISSPSSNASTLSGGNVAGNTASQESSANSSASASNLYLQNTITTRSPTFASVPADASFELVRTLKFSSSSIELITMVQQDWASSMAPTLPQVPPKQMLRVVGEDAILYLRGPAEELQVFARARE